MLTKKSHNLEMQKSKGLRVRRSRVRRPQNLRGLRVRRSQLKKTHDHDSRKREDCPREKEAQASKKEEWQKTFSSRTEDGSVRTEKYWLANEARKFKRLTQEHSHSGQQERHLQHEVWKTKLQDSRKACTREHVGNKKLPEYEVHWNAAKRSNRKL